jgi:hypothetical protein
MDRDTKAVVDAYIECAIWADCPEEDQKHCVGPSPEFEKRAYEDVQDFLDLVGRAGIPSEEWTDEQFGHDFWLTRQGHGTGFWDRGRESGDRLSELSKIYGAKYAYVGDDGLFYAD